MTFSLLFLNCLESDIGVARCGFINLSVHFEVEFLEGVIYELVVVELKLNEAILLAIVIVEVLEICQLNGNELWTSFHFPFRKFKFVFLDSLKIVLQ